MPGPAHETLVALLRARPSLLNDVLAALGRRPLSAGLTPGDSALRVTNPLEVRPDVVYLDGEHRGPWAIVDVQRAKDPDKRRRWPAAAGVLLDARGEMGDVIVITHDASVARWAGEVARVAGPAGTELWLRPVVLKLTRAEVRALLAGGRCELAVVATWAVHDQRGRRAKDVARAAIAAIDGEPDPELRREMLRAMISMLGDDLAAEVRHLIMKPLSIPDSPVYLEIVAALEARGEARGEARALLKVLAARDVAVDDAARRRIVACADVATLDRWIDRAATARSIDEVFAGSGGSE